jgi:hypothetical protein
MPVTAAVLLAVAAGVFGMRSTAPRVPATGTTQIAVAPPAGPAGDTGPVGSNLLDDANAGDDPSLALMGELTSAMEWDSAAEAVLAPSGSAERVVAQMNGAELRELQRLLTEELSRKGA